MTDNDESGTSVPVLPEKTTGSKDIESKPKGQGSKLKNNIFLQNDMNPSPKPIKPKVPLKTWKPPPNNPTTVNDVPNTSPRATQIEVQKALFQLKSVKSDGNNNDTTNNVIRKQYPSKKPPSVKRATIKRKSYHRIGDGKKFLEIPKVKLNLGGLPPPVKPESVLNFDLTKVIKEYNEQLSLLGKFLHILLLCS